MAAPFFWGMVSAAVSGFLVIAFLLTYLRRHDLAVFMWYRLGVAALIIVLVVTGARPATV
jgi:undecaprenyl-diphosphatase